MQQLEEKKRISWGSLEEKNELVYTSQRRFTVLVHMILSELSKHWRG